MYNMLISKNNEKLEFIVYNIVFSEKSRKFTTDFVYQQLKLHNINTDKDKLKVMFERWADNGLIFENGNNGYIINTTD